jgi:hypothetical protein
VRADDADGGESCDDVGPRRVHQSASDPRMCRLALPLTTRGMTLSEFLFVGSTTDKEGATTRIKASGGVYRKKLLASNPENWHAIGDMALGGSIKGVLVTLTAEDYRKLVTERYRSAADHMLSAFKSAPHVVFVHESVFFEPADEEPTLATDEQGVVVDDFDDPWAEEDEDETYMSYLISQYREVDTETRDKVNALLRDHGLNVMPYKTNAERAVMAQSFIEDNDRSLLFRVYVPEGRLYADEADRLLDLFQEWLGATGRASIRRDGYRTGSGQVYEFFGSEPSTGGQLERQFADFSEFLDLCAKDAVSANAVLVRAGMAADRAAAMTTRLAREGRRLQIDLRHTRETRILQLSQLFENEMLEEADVDWKPVLEELIPPAGDIGQALALGPVSLQLPSSLHVRSLTINQQVIQGSVQQVAQSVQGTINLNPTAKELLDIVTQYGGARASELTTAVHELEDEDARLSERLTARQKLRAFLVGVAKEVPAMTLQTIQK